MHSDIGGGYPEQESGAAKYPLAWMIDEARLHGLEFRETMVNRLVKGRNPADVKQGSKRDYSEPSPTAKLHDSMNVIWKILEYLPKFKKYHDDPQKKKEAGLYLPKAEPRYISSEANIDSSVYKRIEATENLGQGRYLSLIHISEPTRPY